MDHESTRQLAEEIREMAMSRGSYATAPRVPPAHGTTYQNSHNHAQIRSICEGVARGEFKLASISDIQSPSDIWRVPGVLDILYGISGPPNIDMRFKVAVEMCATAQILCASGGDSEEVSRATMEITIVALSAPLVMQRALVSIFDMLLPMMMVVVIRGVQQYDGSPSDATDVLKKFIAAFKVVPIGRDSRFASGQSKKPIALGVMRRLHTAPDLMRAIEVWEDDGNPRDYDGADVTIADDPLTNS